MSYYFNWIKLYRSTTDFTKNIKKAIYITQIKDFFKCINIKKRYKKQILDYNIEKCSLIVRANLNIFFITKILIQINQNTVLFINSANNAKKIIEDLK